MTRILLFFSFFCWSISLSANDELLNRFVALREKVIEFYGKYFDIDFPENKNHMEKLTILSEKRNDPHNDGYYQKFLTEFEGDPEGLKTKYGLMTIGHELNPKTPLDFESLIEFFRCEDSVLFKYWQQYVDAKDENIEYREKRKSLIVKIVADSINDRFKDSLPYVFHDFLGVLAITESDFSHDLFLQQLKDSLFFREMLPRVKAQDKTLLDFFQTTTDLDKMLYMRKSVATYDFKLPKLTTKKGQGQHLHKIMEALEREQSLGLFNFVQLDDGRFEVFYSQLKEAYQENFRDDPLALVLEMPAVTAPGAKFPKVALPLSTWRLFTKWPESLGEERMEKEINNFIRYFTKSPARYEAFLYWASILSGKDVHFTKFGQDTSIWEEIIYCFVEQSIDPQKIIPWWLKGMNRSLSLKIEDLYYFLVYQFEHKLVQKFLKASPKKNVILPVVTKKETTTEPINKIVEKKPQPVMPLQAEPEREQGLLMSEVPFAVIEDSTHARTKIISSEPQKKKRKNGVTKNKEKVYKLSDYQRKPKTQSLGTPSSNSRVIASKKEPPHHQKKGASQSPFGAMPLEKKSSHSDAQTPMDRYFANQVWKQTIPGKKSAKMLTNKHVINPENTMPIGTVIEPVAEEPTQVVEVSIKPLIEGSVDVVDTGNNLPIEESVEPIVSAPEPEISEQKVLKTEPSISKEEQVDSFEDQIAGLNLDAFDWQNWDRDDNWFAFNIFQQTWWGQFSWHFEESLDPKDYLELRAIFKKYVHHIGEITAERFKAHSLLGQIDIGRKKPVSADERTCVDLVEQAFWELCMLRAIPVESGFKETMSKFFAHVEAHDKALSILDTQLVEKLKETLDQEGQKLVHSQAKTVHLLEKIKKFILPLSMPAEPSLKVL